MADNSTVYPVGLYYVGPMTGPQPVVPISDGSDAKAILVPDQTLPDELKVKQEDGDECLADDSATYTRQDQHAAGVEDQSAGNSEDRNSESYWEKRKRFTLAFAAGLRKFIQLHPELMRYGPKKSQTGASATVTSSGAGDEDECETSHPVHKTTSDGTSSLSGTSSPALGPTPNESAESSPAPRGRRSNRNAAVIAAIKQESGGLDDDDDDEDYSPRSRGTRSNAGRGRRGRRPSALRRTEAVANSLEDGSTPRKRSRLQAQDNADDQNDQAEADKTSEPLPFTLPPGLTIKLEPLDAQD